jgi:dTDP-4-amino-4,6-dideoxygalactose transaminase
MKVPFLDLHAHHQPIREQLDAAIRDVIDAAPSRAARLWLLLNANSRSIAVPHAMGVGNGTDALWLSLLALGRWSGRRSHHRAQHFHGHGRSHQLLRARPKFVDIDEQTYTMDPNLLERPSVREPRRLFPSISSASARTWIRFLKLPKHGIPVVEDACQAHGALYKGRKAGTMGLPVVSVFIPARILAPWAKRAASRPTTRQLAEKIQVLRDHGQHRKYYHSQIGWNARMDGIQGAVLSVKLKHLDVGNVAGTRTVCFTISFWPKCRKSSRPLRRPQPARLSCLCRAGAGSQPSPPSLADKGISCAIHYPIPVHLQEAYRFWVTMKALSRWPNVARRNFSRCRCIRSCPRNRFARWHGTQIVHQWPEAAKQLFDRDADRVEVCPSSGRRPGRRSGDGGSA